MPRFRERLEKMRIDRLDPPKGFESNGLWFRDPGRHPDRNPRRREKLAQREGHLRHEGRRCRHARTRRTAARRTRCSRAGSRTCCCSSPTSRKAINFYRDVLGLRLSDRSGDLDRLHARHPRQRPSHDRLREVGRAGPAPSELGRRLDQRHRRRREPHGREGLRLWLGARPPRARLELLPLRARSVGQLRRILLRHRLHPGRRRTGRTATIRRRTPSTCGVRTRPRTSRTISKSRNSSGRQASRSFCGMALGGGVRGSSWKTCLRSATCAI